MLLMLFVPRRVSFPQPSIVGEVDGHEPQGFITPTLVTLLLPAPLPTMKAGCPPLV